MSGALAESPRAESWGDNGIPEERVMMAQDRVIPSVQAKKAE
jgi:hypothetical protein